MKTKRDNSGVVFDIYEDHGERCLEIAAHLKETDSKIEFEVTRCTVLPELTEDGGSMADGWRGNSGNNDDSSFGGRHNRHQSFGNGGGYGNNAGGGGYKSGGGKGGFHSR